MNQTITARGVCQYTATPKAFRSATSPTKRAVKPFVVAALDVRKPGAEQHSRVEQKETYLGEKFWQVQPLKLGQQANYRDPASADSAPEVHLNSLNHASLEAADPAGLGTFYTRVLGFKSLDRPAFPFDGAWLEGAGLLLHIIHQDPSVPKRLAHWKDKFAEEPQTWYIRRANHLASEWLLAAEVDVDVAAFEVEDSDAMEARLVYFGIEYTKAIVPGTDAAQLFFFDPEGHGVEVGCDYAKVADMLRSKLGNNGSAVAP